jgi:uncharacterized Rossmann fold enzyme
LLFKTTEFIKCKAKAIPGYAIKAYWGEELMLHILTSDLDRGKLLYPEEEVSTTHQTGVWFSLRTRS